jgi:hypothetical protein
MSHFGLEKFFKPQDGEPVIIKILDEPPLSMGQHYIKPREGWYWDRGLYLCDLPGEPKECTIGGPYDQNIQPTKRYHLPVIHDGEQKILALNSVMMKSIADMGRRIMEELEAKMLAKSQRDAAARFKRSKMFYGAKR